MITGTAIIMAITITTIMIGADLCLVRRRRPEPAARESPQ